MSTLLHPRVAGSAPGSIETAVQNAISRASRSLHDRRRFEAVETRGHIESGEVARYHEAVKVGFLPEDRPADR